MNELDAKELLQIRDRLANCQATLEQWKRWLDRAPADMHRLIQMVHEQEQRLLFAKRIILERVHQCESESPGSSAVRCIRQSGHVEETRHTDGNGEWW